MGLTREPANTNFFFLGFSSFSFATPRRPRPTTDPLPKHGDKTFKHKCNYWLLFRASFFSHMFAYGRKITQRDNICIRGISKLRAIARKIGRAHV